MTELILVILALFIALALVVLVLYWRANNRNPIKTDKISTDLRGRSQRKIKYHDTGKEVRQTFGQDWRGRSVKTTYVDKKCYRCGSMVKSDKQGVYRCTCGRTFR